MGARLTQVEVAAIRPIATERLSELTDTGASILLMALAAISDDTRELRPEHVDLLLRILSDDYEDVEAGRVRYDDPEHDRRHLRLLEQIIGKLSDMAVPA